MQFLFPTFLFALAALAIPIIIHLFYFRRFKKVYFTNVRFLKEVKEETSARQKLRNLLVLLARLLALAFLVFAFAQPYIPQKGEVKKGQKAVSVYVDNSFSMSALSEDVSLLDKARQRATQIVQAYSAEDEFQIITNDFEGRHQRTVGQEDALSLIDELQISPAVKNISQVAARQKQALNSSGIDNQVSYLISDFQKTTTDLTEITDTLVEFNLVPLQSVQEKNVSIDSAWFEAPVQMLNQTNTLYVKIRNLSGEPAENVRLSLRHEGQTKPVGTLNIPARASVTDTVPITILRTGWHEGELSVTDYPVQFDDNYFFSFYVAEQINVLLINDQAANPFLNAAFKGIPYFQAENKDSRALEYSTFPAYQMIVLNELKNISSGLAAELSQFISNGGNLLVFPSASADISSYNAFFRSFPAGEFSSFEKEARIVGSINTEEFVFNDVFENKGTNLKLPASQGNYKFSDLGGRTEERLMTYRDGSSYLSKFRSGKGHLYVSTVPLNEEFNNIVRSSEIFIPMLYKMAISSAQEQKISYTLGKDEVIETNIRLTGGKESVFKLKGVTEEFIPEQRVVASKVFLTVGEYLDEAGIYSLYLTPEEVLGKFAFNFDRRESNLDYYKPAELETASEQSQAKMNIFQSGNETDFTSLIGEQSHGVVLWRWCLILVLLFLALEGLLLRFWKV